MATNIDPAHLQLVRTYAHGARRDSAREHLETVLLQLSRERTPEAPHLVQLTRALLPTSGSASSVLRAVGSVLGGL